MFILISVRAMSSSRNSQSERDHELHDMLDVQSPSFSRILLDDSTTILFIALGL